MTALLFVIHLSCDFKNNLLFYSCDSVFKQAPAIDVIAVGLSSGRIVLHNMRYDETVVSFLQEWGPVTAVTFRTGIKKHIFNENWSMADKSLRGNSKNVIDGKFVVYIYYFLQTIQLFVEVK